jgi:hypothetical protein
MSPPVLLLGRTSFDAERWRAELPHVDLRFGTTLRDAKEALHVEPIGRVIVGAGLPVETRLAVAELVLSTSPGTTLHFKDRASGRDGMLPFVRSIVGG